MKTLELAIVAEIPTDAREWTVDAPVLDEKTGEVLDTVERQVVSNRVYIVERNGQAQTIQSRKALPCISWQPPETEDPVVGRYWKIDPDTREVRDGPRDITKSRWSAWVAAGVIDDVQDKGEPLPAEIPELPR